MKFEQKKRCSKCHRTKPLSEFYKDKQKSDGHRPDCKLCHRKRTARNRQRRMEYLQQWRKRNPSYDKVHYKKNRKRELARAEKYRRENKLAIAAHNAIGVALRDGTISRPTQCQSCGEPCSPEAHHPDYNFPVLVKWLCGRCHKLVHSGVIKLSA